ncbi:substrate-binding domain-containing protein [Natronospora cellulosivora (SeqCode)]
MDNDNFLPKYILVKDKIKDLIKNKEISPGDKIPGENQLCDKYNVSRHTIRRAIDILVQEDILEKRQGLGTFYRGENANRTGNIGFISISLHDYIFADILSAVDNIMHQNNYQIILGNSRDDISREKSILLQFLEKGIDGLIIEPARSAINTSNIDLLEKFASKNIPVVVLDSSYQSDLINTVLVDDKKGGEMAVNHLIEMGHQEIAIIYKATHKPALARLSGYKRAIIDAGLELKDELLRPYFNSEFSNPGEFEREIREILNELLKNKKLTGIFAFNDQIAVLLNELLLEKGLNVPDDISIIAFDDSKLVRLNNISISSIAHPKEKAGKKAAEIIIEELEREETPLHINKVFKPFLCKRSSVKKITRR